MKLVRGVGMAREAWLGVKRSKSRAAVYPIQPAPGARGCLACPIAGARQTDGQTRRPGHPAYHSWSKLLQFPTLSKATSLLTLLEYAPTK